MKVGCYQGLYWFWRVGRRGSEDSNISYPLHSNLLSVRDRTSLNIVFTRAAPKDIILLRVKFPTFQIWTYLLDIWFSL